MAHSEHNLIELKHELDVEDGWSEIVSLGSNQKGWIHKFIDKHYRLKRLFRQVCVTLDFLLHLVSYNMGNVSRKKKRNMECQN
jgi:hypothetical protein